MKGFLALAKVSFLDLLLSTVGGGMRGGRRKRARSGWAALLFLAAIMLLLSGNYSFLLASTFGPMGGLDIMLFLITVMGVFFSTFFTLYLSQSLIFSAKDIDLVLSLPVSTFSVLMARLMALYLEILFMVEIFLIPAGVAWLANGGPGGAGFLLLLMLGGMFFSFIPAFFSLAFGSIIGLLVARTRFKNFFNILFSLVLMGGILFVSLGSSNYLNTATIDVEAIRASLFSALPPFAWAIQAITQPNLLLFLLTILICLAPFLLLAWVISRFYKKLLTSLLSHHVRSDYKLGQVRTGNGLSALCGKEARRFFGTPIYFLNSGIGMVLLLAGGVVSLLFKSSFNQFLASFANIPGAPDVAALLPPILLAFLSFFILTYMPTAVSLSLEGNNLWILKESPLRPGTIFLAKIGFFAAIGMVCCLVAVPMAGYAAGLSIAQILLVLLVALPFQALTSTTGLAINLKYPRLDAENDTIVVKQSASVIISMLASLVEAVLVAGLYYLVCGIAGLSFTVFAPLAALFLAVLCALVALWLRRRGSAIFAAL